MINWLAALLILSRLFLPFGSFMAGDAGRLATQSKPAVEFLDIETSYQFGQQVTFQATITTTQSSIANVVIYITPAGQATSWRTAVLSANNTVNEVIPAGDLSLRPFTQIAYRYQVNLADGKSVTSDEFFFRYDDDRFEWQKLESLQFRIFWYGREPVFGQDVLNIAQTGMKNARGILDVQPPAPINLYVYLTSRDLQTALSMDNQPWIAGHASPDLDQVMISIPAGPEQNLELERQIPHELMHILQYQLVGDALAKQPVWLLEGLASIAELYPNPEYQYVLTEAAKHDLLPFRDLCTSFPREASSAYLAYAQSESFTRFLYQKFGSSGLLALITRYQDGMGCDEGMNAAFGSGLGQLEYSWKQEVLGINAAGLALRNLAPYLLVVVLLVIPAGLALLPPALRKSSGGAAIG